MTGRKLPDTGDIVHDRFLLCVEKGDASGAMAHFAFIACEGGPLMTLRRRQLLVLLCEKGMVKEASELLTSATASPTFNSQDLSTIVSSSTYVTLVFIPHLTLTNISTLSLYSELQSVTYDCLLKTSST